MLTLMAQGGWPRVSGDVGEGFVDRGVEVVAVEGLEEPVVVDEVTEAGAQLDEGEVDALGVELVVEALEHPGRGDVDVGDGLALQHHPRRPALPHQLAHLVGEHARVGEEQRRLPAEHHARRGAPTRPSPPWSLCQPSRPGTRPSTSPCGHQFRWKKSRIDSTTATTMPSRTPRKMTPALATSESTTAERRNLHTRVSSAKSASDSAAAMTTAASAEFGRSARSPLKNTSSSTTTPAPTMPASWLLAPDCSATAVRELLAETANPWKKPAAMLAEPMPIISWFGFTCSPRRALNEVDRAIVSVSDTSVMPTAATSSGTTSPMSVHGTSGVGQPLGKGADGG